MRPRNRGGKEVSAAVPVFCSLLSNEPLAVSRNRLVNQGRRLQRQPRQFCGQSLRAGLQFLVSKRQELLCGVQVALLMADKIRVTSLANDEHNHKCRQTIQ